MTSTMQPLRDSFGRTFEYLRLSLEDTCNFRCVYCLPEGYHRHEQDSPLTLDEIRRLAAAFAGMGFWKFRLTGGEPTVRRDIVDIAECISGTPGVRRVSLSTNGYRLSELARPLWDAGVRSVNVSVDSLDRDRFRALTGQDKLPEILHAIEECLSFGFIVKVNAVLLKDLSESEWDGFLRWTKAAPIDVRFIELMQTGGNLDFFKRRHLSASDLVRHLDREGWGEKPRQPGDGPARVFSRADHAGKIGVIAPYSKDFCSTCNRLRVTSRGGLRLCLFAEQDFSLRRWLQHDDQILEAQEAVRNRLIRKDISHYLPDGRTGNVRNFAMMGG